MDNEKKCPICGATWKGTFDKKLGSWRCMTCFGGLPDSELKEHLTNEVKLRSIYSKLENGRFEDVLREIAEFREELGDEERQSLQYWLDYVELRAEFHILGPIVDARGKDTGCFTPCIIDSFSREKLMDYCHRFDENRSFEGLVNDLLESADNYSAILKQYRKEGVQPFDVFLCHKTDDGGKENTPDFRLARKLYKALSKLGYKVFFAPETKRTAEGIRRLGEYDNNWRKWIYDALLSSRVMFLISTKKEYMTSPNVRNEWVTFRSFKEDGFYGTNRRIVPIFCGSDANECMELLNGDGANTYENSYASFFPEKDKLSVRYLEEFVKTELGSPASGNLRYFSDDPDKLYSIILQRELSGDFTARSQYLNLWRRFRHGDAAVRLGIFDLDDKSYEQAVKMFLQSNTPQGNAYYAQCLFNGWGRPQDRKLAYSLLQDKNDPMAVFMRALFVVHTLAHDREPLCGEFLSERCIEALDNVKDIPQARILLGLCLNEGLGVKKNVSAARRLLEGTEYFRLTDDPPTD